VEGTVSLLLWIVVLEFVTLKLELASLLLEVATLLLLLSLCATAVWATLLCSFSLIISLVHKTSDYRCARLDNSFESRNYNLLKLLFCFVVCFVESCLVREMTLSLSSCS
jgi:steroid 5-alpha reductase family enzyme